MKIKSILTATLVATPLACSAGVMGDLNAMFLSNISAPGTISTRDRTGVFGGSVELRSPIVAVNLVSFDPPRLSAGCGGVDLNMGSFSFLNGSQLVATFRAMATNVAGLAFKAAIKSISPSLDALISEFQTLLQSLNNLGKNSCQMAHLVVDKTGLNDLLEKEGPVSGSLSGMVSDAASWTHKFNVGATAFLKQAGELSPTAGNRMAKAVKATNATAILELAGITNIDGSVDDYTSPNSLNNKILYAFLGYEVDGQTCTQANESGVPNSTAPLTGDIGSTNCKGPATLKLDDLLQGGGTGSQRPVPLTVYKCADPLGTPLTPGSFGTETQPCLNMQKERLDYPGVQGWVNGQLFGSPYAANPTPGSIVGSMNSGASITPSSAQIQFMQRSGLPILATLSLTSNPVTRIAIANRFSEYFQGCMTARLGEAIYRAAMDASQHPAYFLNDDQKRNIEILRGDYMALRKTCAENMAIRNVLQELNVATNLVKNQK